MLEEIRSWVKNAAAMAGVGVKVNGRWEKEGGMRVLAFRLFAPENFDLWDVAGARVYQTAFAITEQELAQDFTPMQDILQVRFSSAMISLWELVCSENTEHNLKLLEAEDAGQEHCPAEVPERQVRP